MTGQAGPAALLAAHPGRVVCEGVSGGHFAAALPAHQAAQVPAQLQGVAAARTLAVEIPGTFNNKRLIPMHAGTIRCCCDHVRGKWQRRDTEPSSGFLYEVRIWSPAEIGTVAAASYSYHAVLTQNHTHKINVLKL